MAIAKDSKKYQITLKEQVSKKLENMVEEDGISYSNMIAQAINYLFEHRKKAGYITVGNYFNK